MAKEIESKLFKWQREFDTLSKENPNTTKEYLFRRYSLQKLAELSVKIDSIIELKEKG